MTDKDHDDQNARCGDAALSNTGLVAVIESAELLRALLAETESPRPWSYEYDPQPGVPNDERIADANDDSVARCYCTGDADLIVAAVNALPALLDAADERDSLRAEVARLREALEPFARAGRETDFDDRARIKNTWFFDDDVIRRAAAVLEDPDGG